LTSAIKIKSTKKPRILISFIRAQVSAILATATDFTIMIVLKEVVGLWYLLAVIFGTLSGGLVGFLLGRNWAFVSTDAKPADQAKKYLLVMAGSFLLNVGGVYLLVELGHIEYIASKIIVSVIVGIGFNFLLQRYFVFK